MGNSIPLRNMSLAAWREQVGRHMVQLDFEPAHNAPFQASLNLLFAHEGTKVARAATSAGVTSRDRTLAKLGAPSYDLLLAQSPFAVEHLGRQSTLRAGDAVFFRNWEPGRLTAPASASYLSVVLPAEIVAEAGLAAPSAGHVIRRENEALGLLRSYLGALGARRPVKSGPLAQEVARHIHVLALSSVGAAHQEIAAESRPAARTVAALAYIDKSFADPALSVARAAADLGISVRYLERLMERSGRTFARRVLDRRLEAAHDALRADPGRALRVSDVALRFGFSDISYFTRCFRAKYGASPGMLRG